MPAPVRPIRPFAVVARVIRVENFVVDARTAEEAEAVATDYIEAGEVGEITETEIEFEDINPVDGDPVDTLSHSTSHPRVGGLPDGLFD